MTTGNLAGIKTSRLHRPPPAGGTTGKNKQYMSNKLTNRVTFVLCSVQSDLLFPL